MTALYALAQTAAIAAAVIFGLRVEGWRARAAVAVGAALFVILFRWMEAQ